MRVVIDTNVWVSRLLLAGSVPARAVDKALAQFEVVVSEASVEELADVLSREKFDRYVSLQDRQEFIRRLFQLTTPVSVLSEISDCKDPKDNHILALALDSGKRLDRFWRRRPACNDSMARNQDRCSRSFTRGWRLTGRSTLGMSPWTTVCHRPHRRFQTSSWNRTRARPADARKGLVVETRRGTVRETRRRQGLRSDGGRCRSTSRRGGAVAPGTCRSRSRTGVLIEGPEPSSISSDRACRGGLFLP